MSLGLRIFMALEVSLCYVPGLLLRLFPFIPHISSKQKRIIAVVYPSLILLNMLLLFVGLSEFARATALIRLDMLLIQLRLVGANVVVMKKYWKEHPEDKYCRLFKSNKKFIQISTDEVYGSLENDGEYFYETTPYDPHSPYSASKASSDMLVKSYMDTYKFPANITNCSNNYGPYQFPEKLIPLIINNALQGKKLPVYGDGKNVRDWLYVEDHAKAIDMVQEKGRLFETYNIGGHNEKQNIEIINIIIETLQEMLPENDPRKALVSKDLITYVEDRKGHDRRYAIAPDKIKAEIGWEPETMFKDGIKLTIKWFFENEEWMKNVTSGDYQKYYAEMYK